MKKSNFGERLREIRLQKNMTQEQIAKKLNLAVSTIGMYERGAREPSFETLENIADFFNIDMDWLLGKSNIQNKYQYEKNITSNKQNKLSEDELISYFRIDTSDLTDDEITEVREELEKYTDMLKLAIKNKRDKK
jgi:transcriptional regulator